MDRLRGPGRRFPRPCRWPRPRSRGPQASRVVLTVRRTDTSVFGRWWWTVDRWTLLAIALLIALGGVLTLAASPAAADRLGLESFHFVKRQLVFAISTLALLGFASLLSPLGVRRLGLLGFPVMLVALGATAFAGVEVNGARRWLEVAGLVIQPSELVKPLLAVVVALLLAGRAGAPGRSALATAAVPLALVLALLFLQPDVGTAVLVATVWLTQVFVAGLSLSWVVAFGLLGAAGAIVAYLALPHVASRIDRFLDPSTGDSFQIDTAREAFQHGGLLGRGPGEGVLKGVLPDAHTDFIFAVAGEEFGLAAGLILLALFAFVVLRCLTRTLQMSNRFLVLAATGLIAQFGLQAVINVGVNLDLMPTKGMTLPFISYGGSSMLGMGLAIGMLLALTRERADRMWTADIEALPAVSGAGGRRAAMGAAP
ncbi:MAG: cell division protein FtsW [Alphaproteobacteria bacterium]|nr:cell division protein FtsW [Alphaproteobacteria bacterium]